MDESLRELLLSDENSKETRPAFLAALITERNTHVARPKGLGPYIVQADFSPFQIERITRTLVTLATKIKLEAEMACSVERNAAQTARDEKNRAQFEAIAEKIGFRGCTSGDPRGPVCRLYDPKDESLGDGWGGGWAVYR